MHIMDNFDIGQIRHKNLMTLISEAGGKVARLSERCDINPAQLSQVKNKVRYASGNIKSIGNKIARKLEKGMEKPRGWMDMSHDAEKGKEEFYNTSDLSLQLKQVCLISWVQAGEWSQIQDQYHPGKGEKPVLTSKNVSKRAFALRVKGKSMENPSGIPTYPEGSIIIVDPEQQAESGSRVVVRLEGSNEATFKQLIIDGNKKYLEPLNPRYPIMEVNGDATICGVVVQTIIDE